MQSDTHRAAAKGDAPALSKAAIPPAPAMPPRLNRPWKPDIMERPLARSTMMAWMFIVTSMVPMPAPNSISAATSSGSAESTARKGSAAAMTRAATIMTRRQPNRGAHAPAMGMVAMEPMPRHSRSSPSAPSLTSACALAKGTSAAQAAPAKPAMKKTTRVACCSATPGRGRERVSEVAIGFCVLPCSPLEGVW